MDLFAVTGKPISHSRSPLIFNASFNSRSQDAIYFRMISDGASESLSVFKDLGMRGMNVTAPYKEKILPLLDSIDSAALEIGSVNTIINKEGKIHGYNTDHIGISKPLLQKEIDLSNASCLVIGAGGTARAVVYGLKQLGVDITLINRTYDKAVLLAERFGVKSANIDDIEEKVKSSRIIVSTLSAGINVVKKEWLKSDHIIFDVNYKASSLSKIAKEQGCTIIKGEEMLVEQAVAGYELFTGNESDRASMYEAVFETIPKRKHISLIGFMGSGKSTVGKLLSQKLDREFIDSDEAIEKEAGMSIPEIFSKLGEREFRRIEALVLDRILNSQADKLIAWGGGVVLSEENKEKIKKQSLPIWLHVDPSEVVQRITKGSRPLLDVENPIEEAKKIYKSRIPYYASCCEMMISTNTRKPEEIAVRLAEELAEII